MSKVFHLPHVGSLMLCFFSPIQAKLSSTAKMNRISLVFTILVVSFVIISYETTDAFTGGGIVGRGIGRSEVHLVFKSFL